MKQIGIIEDNLDPLYQGRVKVRLFGKHTQKDAKGKYIIDVDSLPWTTPKNCGGTTYKLGDIVITETNNDYNIDLLGPLYPPVSLVKHFGDHPTDYENAKILVWDEELGLDIDDNNKTSNSRKGEYVKVYYMDSTGLVMEMNTKDGLNKIVMDPNNNINITNAGGSMIDIDFAKKTIKIKTDSTINIEADNINLGKNAVSGLIKDNFKQLFNSHTHMVPGIGMSDKPIVGVSDNMITKHLKIGD